MRLPWVTSLIIGQLQGSFVSLSFSKYGSNVVEKCMRESEEHLSGRVITEIIRDPDHLKVFGHDYGNYVIQSALWVSKVLIFLILISVFNYFQEFNCIRVNIESNSKLILNFKMF